MVANLFRATSTITTTRKVIPVTVNADTAQAMAKWRGNTEGRGDDTKHNSSEADNAVDNSSAGNGVPVGGG